MAINRLEAFVEDTVVADVADYAAASGISFDEAIEELVAQGLATMKKVAKITKPTSDLPLAP